MVSLGYFLASITTTYFWHLYFTQGVMVGVGYSLGVFTSVPIVCHWFKKKRGLANGVQGLSAGVGMMVTVVILEYLLSSSDWRAALLWLALINLITFTLAAVLIKRRIPVNSSDQGCCKRISTKSESVNTETITINRLEDKQETLIEYVKNNFKNRKFAYLYFAYLTFNFGVMIPYIYLPLYAQSEGYSLGNRLLFLIGLGYTVGTIILALIADYYGKFNILRISMFLTASITMCWLGMTKYGALIFYAIAFGFFRAPVSSLLTSICGDLFGIKRLGAVIGLLYTSCTFGDLFATPVASAILSGTGSYDGVIIFSSICMFIGCLLLDLLCDSSSVLLFIFSSVKRQFCNNNN